MYVLWIVCPFVLFHLGIVLSVLRYTDSDYSFGIFKLFLAIDLSNKSVMCLVLVASCMRQATYFADNGGRIILNIYSVHDFVNKHRRLLTDKIGIFYPNMATWDTIIHPAVTIRNRLPTWHGNIVEGLKKYIFRKNFRTTLLDVRTR